MTLGELQASVAESEAHDRAWVANATQGEIEAQRVSRERWFGPTKFDGEHFVTDWDRVGPHREDRLPKSRKRKS